ncbi:MAG: hypothetical protein JST00_29120 [Deltaproteobacteria bacterium]|nr:hypothetical protein [Deltaproteobacteria bacterium]
MKKIAFIVAAASLFAIAPIAGRFGAVPSSIALVWLGVLVAVCASGTVQSLAVASGALGAFGSGVLASVSPAAAGAVIVAAAFAERTTRVRSKTARAVHVLVALVGGALAGSLSTAFTASSLPVLAVSVIVASVLAALPLLVDADDPVAHALDLAARDVSEPAKASLVSGAELRRQIEDIPLDTATQDRVKKTWQSLVRLAEARVRLEKSRPKTFLRIDVAPPSAGAATTNAADAVLGMVDQKIADHVNVLAKAYSAVDTARAAAVGLDDAALKTVEVLGESLEEESRAMVEVKAAG